MSGATETATLGGGCFWCLEAAYQEVRGVESVKSGYAGGQTENPGYREVCAGTTGHAEVVQVAYDPSIVSYRDLLEVFFGIHDPTTPDRQGNDVGTQYRSIILYHDDAQRSAARAIIEELEAQDAYDAPIVTQVEPLERFWPAEAYHDDYFRRNPAQMYCQAVIAPKLSKFRRKYAELRREEESAAGTTEPGGRQDR